MECGAARHMALAWRGSSDGLVFRRRTAYLRSQRIADRDGTWYLPGIVLIYHFAFSKYCHSLAQRLTLSERAARRPGPQGATLIPLSARPEIR